MSEEEVISLDELFGPIEDEDDNDDIYDDEEEDEEFYDGIVRAKWIMDGAETFEEAADKVEAYSLYLRSLHEEGYLLRRTIDDDYGFYYHPDGRHKKHLK